MATIHGVLYRTASAIVRRRLARVMIVVTVAAAGVLTVSGAAGAASASGFNEIRNTGTGKCLDVTSEDGFFRVGARVQQYHCTRVKEQKWSVKQIISPTGGLNPAWEIINLRSGLCLGRGAFAVDGQQAIQMGCDGSRQVAWVAGDLGNGNFYLDNLYDFRVLNLSRQSSADHAKVQLWTYNASVAQQWRSASFFPPAI